MDKVSKRTRFAWYLYDWANSAFVTSVITVFLGPYLTLIASRSADLSGNLNFLGLEIYSESLFSYIVSFSVLLQVVFFPIIGSYADSKNNKKSLLYIFAYFGSVFTIGMFFLTEKTIFLGSFLFVLANVLFGASIVMYNSLLLNISSFEERDKVSSMGWAFGYIGGGILLGLNIVLISLHENFCITQEDAIRISFAMAGFWWLLFSFISHINLKITRTNTSEIQSIEKISYVKKLTSTFKEIIKNKNALWFFLAFLFFNDAVQTVIIISTQFGKRELNLGMDILILVVLLVQFLSFFGTLLVLKLSSKLKTKRTLIICLTIWCVIVVYAYLFLKDEVGFFILAILISLVLGGTQAMSRALFSYFIPKNSEAQYFSFYEITEKGSSWIGPLTFGIILQITKSYRLAILSLILFFVLGLIFLAKVRITEKVSGENK
ncbi:MAG: MFS transporter [Ignavibacteria bacterium]|nr:MFS transporter [Ignavibacteria bacterium]